MSIPCIYKTIEIKEGEAVPDFIEFGRLDYSVNLVCVCATSKEEPWVEDNYGYLYSMPLETSLDGSLWYRYSDFYPNKIKGFSAEFVAWGGYSMGSFIRIILKNVFPAGWTGKITVRVDFV